MLVTMSYLTMAISVMYLVALPLIWSEAEHDLVVMITKKFAFEKQARFVS